MKNILLLVVVALVISGGMGTLTALENRSYEKITVNEQILVTPPSIDEQNHHIFLDCDQATSYLYEDDKPVLPIITRVFEFPFGSKIQSIDVQCTYGEKIALPTQMVRATPPLTLGLKNFVPLVNNQFDTGRFDLYPSSSYNYEVKVGLNGENHVIYLIIQCYPYRYLSLENVVWYTKEFDISIRYYQPLETLHFPDEYDLVVIAPSEFSSDLQPLVDHKNNIGVKTILKTTQGIFSTYGGMDKPEQIKYFIKDAIEQWGSTYVLLVGGLNSLIYAHPRDDPNQGSSDWWLPVRYTNLRAGGSVDDPGYISDLYYADVYKFVENETIFDNWDSNGDGILAQWIYSKRDTLDLYPDVYVGRLACRNVKEVRTMVNKIINYESSLCDPSWFNKMVVVGGDTFDTPDNIFEGEVENQKALDYMTGFEPVKVWASNRDTGGPTPQPDDIITTVSKGCGFLYIAGHGSPELWYTYWPNHTGSIDKFMWFHVDKLSNGDKLPVCVVGSCHGSQFNTTATSFINLYLHKIAKRFNLDFLDRYSDNTAFPTPECFCWRLTRVVNGGPISTIGNTGIGYGTTGDARDRDGDGIDDPDCVEALGGYLETQFFKAYGVDGISELGKVWGSAIANYLDVYPGMKSQTDCKTVQQWVLFGDPSLKIGGYAK